MLTHHKAFKVHPKNNKPESYSNACTHSQLEAIAIPRQSGVPDDCQNQLCHFSNKNVWGVQEKCTVFLCLGTMHAKKAQ